MGDEGPKEDKKKMENTNQEKRGASGQWQLAAVANIWQSAGFRCVTTVVAVAGMAWFQPAPAQASVTISPGLSGDDTARIQQAIDNSTGAVHFEAGVYKLHGSVHLRANRTYTGEGSWDPRYGSVLTQMAGTAVPIFSVDGLIGSVTIIGLTLDGAAGTSAKGIAAAPGVSTALLANSTIRDSYFLAGLAECIDTPLVGTRIERSQFGLNGGSPAPTQRHIHSVYPDQNPESNANWIVGNQFSSARGGESVLIESGVQLHLAGNIFEGNQADRTVRLHGMFQVVIEGNYFERNSGAAQMSFGNANSIGNYIVRLENNFYNMQGSGNQFILEASGATQFYMGYEAGTLFPPTVELLSDDLFAACYLKITGPFHLNGYMGSQTSGNPKCH
jgi:hypothetical protein